MDKIGLRTLLEAGISRAQAKLAETGEDAADSSLDVVLDRLAQAGQIALIHQQPWLLDEVARGLLKIFQASLPANRDAMHPDVTSARRIFDVGARVWILGADAVVRKRYEYLRTIVLQRPVEDWRNTFWLRYTVTMAARGDIGVLRGKSLIGPISELIRDKPQFFAAFESNLDIAVNSLCQFDFLSCVMVINETNSMDYIYPNFGGYYSERTMAVVENLISGGSARAPLESITDERLAEILFKLDRLTSRAFFGVNGWHGYSEKVMAFIKNNGGDSHGEE